MEEGRTGVGEVSFVAGGGVGYVFGGVLHREGLGVWVCDGGFWFKGSWFGREIFLGRMLLMYLHSMKRQYTW